MSIVRQDEYQLTVVQQRRTLQIRATKSHILRTALTNLNPSTKNGQLPSELLELIYILSLQLSNPSLPESSLKLLESSLPYQSLRTYIPQISSLLSTHLQTLALALTRLAHPSTNPSFLHRSIPKLPATMSNNLQAITDKKRAVATSRQALITSTAALLHLYTQATELTIQHLERVKHGQILRHTKARLTHLSLSAQQMALHIQSTHLTALGQFYSAEVLEALAVYKEHLRDARSRLRQRGKDAKASLRMYGMDVSGEGGDGRKEKVMKELARVYGECMGRLEDVKRDIERLDER
jgi:hypothetical protein